MKTEAVRLQSGIMTRICTQFKLGAKMQKLLMYYKNSAQLYKLRFFLLLQIGDCKNDIFQMFQFQPFF